MKTVLIEALAFVLICVLGTAAGGFLIMLFTSVSNFVVGCPLDLFSAQGFIKGAIIIFPVLLLFVPMFLYLTLIRHPKYNKISGVATIAVLSLAAWIFLAPISHEAAKSSDVFHREDPTELSPGYFRNINQKNYYFTFISGNYASGIKIDGDYFLSNNNENSVHTLDSNYIRFRRDALGFSDSIVGENMTPPEALLYFLRGVTIVQQKAYEASSAGKIEWLLFSSIMVALVAMGAVVSASEWKLADAFYITFDSFAILAVNALCLLGFFDKISKALYQAGPFFAPVASHLQVAINCLIVLLLISMGTFKAVVHAAKNKRRGE